MIIKPPTPLRGVPFPSVFLAGSIEMGKAEDWQTQISKPFDDAGFTVLNPRRDDWDSSWVTTEDNLQFAEQVNWEREGLKKAHYVLFYFQPGTRSPISLYELGRHAKKTCHLNGNEHSALAVVCPEGFWRKGNVDLECRHHQIPRYSNLDDAAAALIELSENWV